MVIPPPWAMFKTRLDNLKFNTTHWQINKYWPKALLVTSVQHERLLRFHTAESSGRCPENYLHWLVIFSPPCPFHRRRCCCGCPLSRCLTSWDSGNIGGERSHSRVGRYEMTQAFVKVSLWFDKRQRWQKVGCLQRGDVIRRQKHRQHDETFTDSNISSTGDVPILLLLLLLSSRALSPDTEAAHNPPLLERLNRN